MYTGYTIHISDTDLVGASTGVEGMQEPGQRLRAAAQCLADNLFRHAAGRFAVLPRDVVQTVPQSPAVQVMAAAHEQTYTVKQRFE